MPTFQYSPTVEINSFFDISDWVLTSVSSTTAVWESGDQKLVVTGTGFSLANGGAGTITGAKLYEVDLASGSAVDALVATNTTALSLSFAGMLNAVANSDFAFGGAAYIFSGNDTLNGSTGEDFMEGGAGNDLLNGGAGNDYLSGDDEFGAFGSPGGRDTLNGGDGDDVLSGGSGNDSMAGGNGNDYYFVTDAGDVVTEASGSTAGTRDRVNFSTENGLLSYTLPANVENLEVSPDSLAGLPEFATGTGNALANKITVIEYGGFSPSSTKLFGLGGNDRLTGGMGRDSLDGGSGNDTMIGGLGSDTYTVDALTDTVSEAIVFPVPNSDVDTLIFNVTTVSTVSLGGTVSGLAATKTYSGIESLNLGTSTTLAHNGIGNDAANTITGNSAINKLYGLNGNDALNGGAGNDSLDGGAGNDNLTGGKGLDTFRFSSALNGSTNVDKLLDFSVTDDRMELENSVFTKLTTVGALSASNFHASTTGNAADSNDFVLYETDTGKLFYDADGSGAGAKVLIATLTTLPTLTSADIFVT